MAIQRFSNGAPETNFSTPPISERQFLSQVRSLAAWTGWMIYHTHNSVHSPAGFPDLVLLRKGRLIFAELKSEAGRPTPDQNDWLDELRAIAGVETYFWRPSDLDDIGRILAEGR